jgi:DNA polymerase (family 10)
MENHEVAAIFHEMAAILEIKDENPFRIRAFRRVAQAVETLPERAETMLAAGTLGKVPGIGKGTLARIREIVESGDCADHAELRGSIPPGLLELTRVEGLGPKTIALVYRELGVSSVDELEAAARGGHLAQLPRMGEKSQAKLLQAIEAYHRHTGRVRIGDALPQGLALLEALRQHEAVQRIDLAGSSRRRRDTIGDLDLLVASDDPTAVMDCFVSQPAVADVMLRGDTKCSVHLKTGLQVDLRVVVPPSFGAALHYFTGSKMHNIAIRDRAKRKGLRINEYGVHDEASGEQLGGATEEEIFAAVDLPYIPPELRENQGEIEAAEAGELPRLITEEDLRGDLHLHTDATDGKATAREMAGAAAELGYEYIAVTDHSKALTVTLGLDEKRLRRQVTALRKLEQELGSIRILTGIEVDILADGTLDLALPALRKLDWVIASVHSHFNLPTEEQTARLVAAMETGVVDCLGHPSGRILGHRDGYGADLDRVIRRAGELGVALELNSFPDRLDLDAPHCRQARELEIPLVINTDAHATSHLALRRYGIYTARRGWLEASDVLNTRPYEELRAWIDARRS